VLFFRVSVTSQYKTFARKLDFLHCHSFIHSFFKPNLLVPNQSKMQFSIIVLAAFAASAYAGPTGVRFTRQGCDAVSCAEALGPTAVSCVSAATQEGVDPVSDAGCLESGLSALLSPPSACNGCASAIIPGIQSAARPVESIIKSIF